MYRLVIIIATLVLLAGIANGISDSLQFHYSTSFAADYDAQFWNPAISWENKYKKVDGELVRPLQPRHFGSKTFLVFTTDAWHLSKFLYHAFIRLALTILLLLYILGLFSLNIRGWKRWLFGMIIYLSLAGIQAAGFHVFYTLL